jgi:hypothetical protein
VTVETLAYIVGAIIATISFFLFGRLTVDSFLKWSEPRRRAGELLLAVLTPEQYNQLMRRGYVDIPSPRDQERTYRVPQGLGLVRVIEKGRQRDHRAWK